MPPPYGDCAGLPGLERVLRGVGTDRRRAHRRAPGQWWAGTGRRPAFEDCGRCLQLLWPPIWSSPRLPEVTCAPARGCCCGSGHPGRGPRTAAGRSGGVRPVLALGRCLPRRLSRLDRPGVPRRPQGLGGVVRRPGRAHLRRPAPPRRHLGQVPRPRPPARHRAAGRAGHGRPVAVVPVEVLRLRDARDRADRALAGGQRAPAQGHRGLPHHRARCRRAGPAAHRRSSSSPPYSAAASTTKPGNPRASVAAPTASSTAGRALPCPSTWGLHRCLGRLRILRPQACLLRQAGVRVATAATTLKW